MRQAFNTKMTYGFVTSGSEIAWMYFLGVSYWFVQHKMNRLSLVRTEFFPRRLDRLVPIEVLIDTAWCPWFVQVFGLFTSLMIESSMNPSALNDGYALFYKRTIDCFLLGTLQAILLEYIGLYRYFRLLYLNLLVGE